MKTTAISLLGAVLVCLGKVSAQESLPTQVEVCFVLDTTGSMTGLLEGAKLKIWTIANEIARSAPTARVKFGLVAYRDHGDRYLTIAHNLTDDLDAIYAQLLAYRAEGGGDEPEAVNEALDIAVRRMPWSADPFAARLVFLVGDAPPQFYWGAPHYRTVCAEAVRRGIIINTIQCGTIAMTTPFWQEIAALTGGQYAAIGMTGHGTIIVTPEDRQIIELSRALNRTVIPYGEETARREVAAKQSVAARAPATATVERAIFNATTGKAVQGRGDLIAAVSDGSVKLDEVRKEQLPADLQKLSSNQLKTYVETQQKQREQLQTRIVDLSAKRSDNLAAKKESNPSASFDATVTKIVRSQLATKKTSETGK